MPDLDPRLTPARPDLAAAHLKGHVSAAAYVEGTPHHVVSAAAALRTRPDAGAGYSTELLFGESFTVYDIRDGWAWGQAALDGYVGYTEAVHLKAGAVQPTHTIAALRSFVYPDADLKTPPLALLSLNAKVTVTGRQDRFSAVVFGTGTGFVFTDHLATLEEVEDDYVALAERLIGTPYLWGGRQSLGLDCSGLVQSVLARAGHAAPRDTDMQERALGTCVATRLGDVALQRGDLVFWKGHVGIMVNADDMVHANATHMAVTRNNLAAFAAAIEASDGPVTSIKRLS